MTSPAPDKAARERLDRLMGARRADLRLHWKDVAARAGLTTEGLRGVRFGSGEIRELTKRGIEDALQWAPGSIDAILNGGEPTLATPHARISQVRMTVPEPPADDDDEDPRMQRAAELLAEATALLQEMRRERREGA